MRWSIKTRLIILFTALLAVVLALQLYFMEQTSRDVFEELNQISVTINQAADLQILRTIGPEPLPPKPGEKPIFRPKDEKDIDLFIKKLKNGKIQARILRSSSQLKKQQARLSAFMDKFKDSLKIEVEEVEVQLDKVRKELNKIKNSPENAHKIPGLPAKAPSFTFTVPDFTRPDKPRIMRYKYNTLQLQNALAEARNHNLLITGLFFGLTILVMALMTRRFLKPIDSLKHSFDKVVDGDLSVRVEASNRDEIGGLAVSFNKMVDELRKNREKEQLLQRKERLASLGQLAAGVAHEIKNPLNAINLTIEHLNDKFINPQDEQARQYIATIQGEIRRLDKIVNNFLNYLRSEELELKETDVNALLGEILQLYEREISAAQIKLDVRFARSFIIQADGERLKTALVNVIVNAVQAMPRGGELTIATHADERKILIKDTGQGIPEKELEHIFDLFYTTKASGSGLGLPTAYKIVKAHKGEILIDSKEGRGTEVRIML